MTPKAVYRILDANFNRAREALRVIEEYCRFVLDHKGLCGRTKQLRHALCGALSQLDNQQLLACRDTVGDVGTDLIVDQQLTRTSLESCLTAAAKRLPEALRALSELIQTFDPALAAQVEQIRYQAYTLEKDIAVLGLPCVKYARVRLYVLVTSNTPEEILRLTAQCARGGADCIQWRAKESADKQRVEIGRAFVSVCRDHGVVSIINDRVDIAVATGADGVHLGSDDLPVREARALQSAPLIIGKTTHNSEELSEACLEQPTYVALGPAFATSTKPGLQVAGLDYVRAGLQQIKDQDMGHVVIGGITEANLDQVLTAGAQTIAVCSAVTQAPDPTDACRHFKERLLRHVTCQLG
ncbi:MAG: thiamine phosphate synthase [Phycisphaerae bacterium]|nr:thiamine phosphate synthase [Phycisphaerae bacterium]